VPSGHRSRGLACPPHKESGVLTTRIRRGRRPGAALFLCGSVLVAPLLLIHNEPDAGAAPTPKKGAAPARLSHREHRKHSSGDHQETSRLGLASDVHRTGRQSADSPRPPDSGADAGGAGRAEAVLSESAAGQSATEKSATAAAVVAAPPTTTTTTTTTSTTLPPAAPAPNANAVSNGPADVVDTVGQVTYYAHPAGECASPWLPFGTVVRITNPANDASVSCVVNDREADTERAIDLSTATFAEIAPLGQGVIDAELSW
jgi:hypothetical protein